MTEILQLGQLPAIVLVVAIFIWAFFKHDTNVTLRMDKQTRALRRNSKKLDNLTAAMDRVHQILMGQDEREAGRKSEENGDGKV